jgi:hypothetical protein
MGKITLKKKGSKCYPAAAIVISDVELWADTFPKLAPPFYGSTF